MLRRRPDFVIPRKLNQQIEPRSSDYVLAPIKNAINHHRDNIDRLVETLQPLIDEYAVKPSDGDANSDGAYFGAADSACAYAMVRHFKPKLILEIGCGQSTHVMRKALDDTKYGGGDAGRIVSIDPAPRKSIEQVADQIYYSSVLNVEPDIFDKLQSGDILFIDGSHYSFNVTDVTYLFLEILPCLKPGIIVHVHDIFLPYEYPQDFTRRLYNEQYVLAAMVMDHSAWEVLLPVYAETKARRLTFDPEGGSFWLRRR